MSTARDQFAEDIYTADRAHKNDPPSLVTHYSYVIADELIAAGYRKPRTIATAEELDALPVNAVIRGKWLAEKWGSPEGDMWFIAGRNMEWFTDDIVMRGGLPATVLYEPEPQP